MGKKLTRLAVSRSIGLASSWSFIGGLAGFVLSA